MIINFLTLTLQFKKEKDVLDLSYQVVFFHGEIGSGKSSIARLINFCLGGNLEKTPALMRELISATLELNIGQYHVLLERDALNDSTISATCVDQNKDVFTVTPPISGGLKPVWADKVYNISDLIFYLLDLSVIRIPANRSKEDANLVRLSIRNFMWYCYLDQSKLDNSFFRMEDPQKQRNSREVLKYILQYSTQRLVQLEEGLQRLRKTRFESIATAKGLREFLKKFGFSTESEIESLVKRTKDSLDKVIVQQKEMESGYRAETHSSDELRNRIRGYIESIAAKEEAISELESRIGEQESLRLELVSMKFKLIKSASVATVFSGVEFEHCPACGNDVTPKNNPDICNLCGTNATQNDDVEIIQPEVVQSDLSDRIKELENSIELHKKGLIKVKRQFNLLKKNRRDLDEQLQEQLKQYESVFLSNVRNLDRTASTLHERMKSLERLKKMPQEINRLEDDAVDILKREGRLKQLIIDEKAKLISGESLIKELEEQLIETLIQVGMPGVSVDDKVVINRKTWEVMIWPKGEDYLGWNFYNAGSGGKKTLFNSCFLLAVHIIAARHNLPLPTFIIIDTPMKNIDKEVNQDIFRNFYNYIYSLAGGVLDQTQFIIVDNNYIPPPPKVKLKFFDRYMTKADPQYPPLIKYYIGP